MAMADDSRNTRKVEVDMLLFAKKKVEGGKRKKLAELWRAFGISDESDLEEAVFLSSDST